MKRALALWPCLDDTPWVVWLCDPGLHQSYSYEMYSYESLSFHCRSNNNIGSALRSMRMKLVPYGTGGMNQG